MSDDQPAGKDNAPKKAPKPLGNPRPGAPSTKAQHAALKRVDKTVIKRMRKR